MDGEDRMEGFQSKNHCNISVDPPHLLFSPSKGLEQLLIKIPERGNLIENKKNRTAMYRLEVRSALKSSLGGGFWSWYFAYCKNGKEHKVQKALQVSTREGPEKKEEKE